MSTLTFTVTDNAGHTASATIQLTVQPAALAITTATLPDAQVGVPYSFQLTESGGTPPYTWTETGLPAGLTMSPAGLISGTPT